MSQGVVWAAVLLLLALPVRAEPGGTSDALARAQRLLQQVGREKAALETEMSQVLAERARLVREVDRLRDAVEVASREAAQDARARDALEARLADTAGTNERLAQALATASTRVTALERELTTRKGMSEKLTTALSTQTARTNEVIGKNRALVDLVHELMQQLARKRGVLSSWLAAEPVTGIAAVDVETTLQTARARLAELGVRPTTGPGHE